MSTSALLAAYDLRAAMARTVAAGGWARIRVTAQPNNGGALEAHLVTDAGSRPVTMRAVRLLIRTGCIEETYAQGLVTDLELSEEARAAAIDEVDEAPLAPPTPEPAPPTPAPPTPEPAPAAPEPSEPMPAITLPPDGTSVIGARLAEAIGLPAARAAQLVTTHGLTAWQQRSNRNRWCVTVDAALVEYLEESGITVRAERDASRWELVEAPADVSAKRPEAQSAGPRRPASEDDARTTEPELRHAGDGAVDDAEAPADPQQEARDSAFLRNVADRVSDPGLRTLLRGLADSEPPAPAPMPSIPGPANLIGLLNAAGPDRQLTEVIEDAQQEAAAVARYLHRTRDALHVTRQRLEGYAEGAIVEMAVDELSLALGAVADVEARLARARRRLPSPLAAA